MATSRQTLSYSSSRKQNVFHVDKLQEKPSLEVAKEYMKQSNYLWNSGIFIWNVNTIINAFRVYEPNISEIFEDMLPDYGHRKGTQSHWWGLSWLCEEHARWTMPSLNVLKKYLFFPLICVEWLRHMEFTARTLRRKINMVTWRWVITSNSLIHIIVLCTLVVRRSGDSRSWWLCCGWKDGKLLICKLSEEQRIKLFH